MGLFFTSRCQICTTPIKRSYHVWTTSNGRVKVCPKCNSRLENQKSRAAFDPSKPFVFPQFQQARLPGCSKLFLGIFTFFFVVSLITVLINPNSVKTEPQPGSPQTPQSSSLAEQPQKENPPQPAALDTKPAPPPPLLIGTGPQLKNVTNFPVTLIVTNKIDVLTKTGGFGLEPGDELQVLQKDGAIYTVTHKGHEFELNSQVIENMNIK